MSPKQAILGAVIAGLVTFGVSPAFADDAAKDDASGGGNDIDCHGGNMCKGKGDCGGPGYSCAGNNACLGKGFVTVKSQKECDALVAKVKAEIAKRKKSKSKKS